MGIDDEKWDNYRFFLEKHTDLGDNVEMLGFKPSWNRMSLHYTFNDVELDYLLFAIKFVCDYGHLFLPVYNFDPVGGEWYHISGFQHKIPKFDFDSLMNDERHYVNGEEERVATFEKQKQEAMKLLETLPKSESLDRIDEVFFYVEQSRLLHRDLIEEKCKLKNQLSLSPPSS